MPISTDPDKLAFLNKLSTVFGADAKFETNDRLKEQALKATSDALTDEVKAQLRQQMTFKLRRRGSWKRVRSMDKGGQIKSVETAEAASYQSLSKKEKKQTDEAMGRIMDEAARLSNARDADGKPLFTAEEIRKEFFDPLVREGIMPENLVPDQFSSTQKLLDKSMKRYKQSLARQNQKVESEYARNQIAAAGGGGTKNRAMAKTQIWRHELKRSGPNLPGIKTANERNKMMRLVGYGCLAHLEMSGAEMADMEAIGTVAEPLVALTGLPELIGEAEQMALDQVPPEVLEKVNAIISDVEPFVSEADLILYGKDDPSNPTLLHEPGVVNIAEGGKGVVSAGVKAGTAVGMTVEPAVKIKTAMNEKEENVADTHAVAFVMGVASRLKKALDPIDPRGAASVIDAFFLAADADLMGRALAGKPPDGQTVVRILSAALASSMKEAAPSGEGPAFESLGKEMAKAFEAAVKPAALVEVYQKDKNGAARLLQTAADAALDGMAGKSAGSNPQAAHFASVMQDPAAQDEMRDKIIDARNRQTFADFEKDQKEFKQFEEELKEYQQQLSQVDRGGALMAKANPIDKMIFKLKRDRAVLEMAASLTSGLPGATGVLSDAIVEGGATFLEGVGPLLRAAGLTAQLVVNIIQAAQRWDLWYTFRTELDRAKNAVSSLSPAIQGLYKNKQEQIAYHTIEDALLVARIAGELTAAGGGFAALGGYSAPAALAIAQCGKAVSKTALAAQYANKAGFGAYDFAQLKRAWQLTKKAMNEPHNRRKGLKAQMKNPTLALHAIIWAGLEDDDPIARQVMNACGLTERTLDDPGTSAEKVLDFFQALLYEDRKLLDPERAPVAWRPKTLELTRASWLVAKQRAQTYAQPKLGGQATGGVEAALAVVEKHPDYATVKDTAKLEGFAGQLDQLAEAFQAYVPVNTEGRVHPEMQEVVKELIDLVGDRQLGLLDAMVTN